MQKFKKNKSVILISIITLGLYWFIKSMLKFSKNLDKVLKTLFPVHYYKELNEKIRREQSL